MGDAATSKTLKVIEVQLVQNVATNEPLYQVVFGEFIPSISNENVKDMKVIDMPNIVLMIHTKTVDKILYNIGSEWIYTVTETGSITLVEKQ
ncbi:MAG: hypothetical protein FWH37_08935 [Candidatus Bathyarchaeota archaeon]|nr:hypothetical protein [Candidatus Termiticorpusculum sp.]